MSADNNPMVLVELTGLSYRYGPTIYAVDRVNGTMYGRFGRGFRIINERATVEPQYRGASLAGMYGPVQPMHMSTLPGMTQMVTPLAESTPMVQNLKRAIKEALFISINNPSLNRNIGRFHLPHIWD